MSDLPPLPPGYRLAAPPPTRRDPWEVLQAEGFVATNGFRTGEDVEDIRAQGYKPVRDGAHNRGDGVDLDHPKYSAKAQERRLRFLAKKHGWDATILDEGHHRHLAIAGWGAAPGTPGTKNSGLPPLPAGYTLAKRGSLNHDGDTVRLSSGQNGRLSGADAWELEQQGRERDGSLVPLGQNARNALAGQLSPGMPVTPTGDQSYGRPIVTLGQGDEDPAIDLLRGGHALAMPQYLQNDARFADYMEAERLARLSRQGGHATNAETPRQFRHKDGPWQGAEPGEYGKGGQAVFWDEPSPQTGLRPEIEQGWVALHQSRNPNKGDYLAYAEKHGFQPNLKKLDEFLEGIAREPKRGVSGDFTYEDLTPLLTDPGDGRVGTTLRGVADPFNMIDELGGVADTLGIGMAPDGPRETIWGSDRRFGDILDANIGINRSIIAHDDAEHPYYRLGGQLASGVALPYGAGVRSVAGLAKLGGIEGFAAGLGAGEGGLLERMPNAAAGGALGIAAGGLLGGAIKGAPIAYRAGKRLVGREAGDGVNVVQDAAFEAAPVVHDGIQQSGPTPAARSQPQGGVIRSEADGPSSAAMRMEDEGGELVGSAPREHDYILPPLPRGYVLQDDVGLTPRMGDQPTAAGVAAAARSIAPEDVVPVPGGNRVDTLEEAQRANPGTLRELEAPNEFDELGVRKIPSRKDLYKSSNIRGPIDITQSIRMLGGVRDDGGDLASMGIGNAARRMPFGSNEQFLGKLINNDDGLSLDEATERLWEEGYFPEFGDQRPTINDLLDRLGEEATGARRYFHPDDLEEVARYRTAQAERFRIEDAASGGSPIVDEVGTPATLDDLRASDPPAVAYEDLPKLGGKVGNIDLSKIETKEDIGRLLQTTESRFGGFDAARRGKISHAETEALASELGLTVEDLLRRRPGQALNAEQALAARRMLAKSGEEVITLAKKVRGGSDELVAGFHLAVMRHAAIQEQVTGATAEAGRALSQFRVAAKAKAHKGRILEAIIRGAGGKTSLEDAADMILELQREPGALNRFALDVVKPTWKDKLVELWYNSLLSGPQTHAVNILSNTLTAALQIPEHAAAAVIGAGRSAASKLRPKSGPQSEIDRVIFSEVGARTVGLLQGAREGVKAFRHTLITGDVPDIITKVESQRHEAIGGLKGKVLRTPTRLLSAEDEFFKAVGRRMEIGGLAVRQARREGLRGDKLKDRIAELTRNPTDEMVEQSMDYARYVTFTRPLGPSMQKVMGIVQEHPWLKLFVPFIRTPTNIFKYAIERSPAAPMLREVRTDLRKGGAARDLAAARIGLGTGLGLMVGQWVGDGLITGGGPSDKNAKRVKMASGWQPYSIKIGGTYYSYKRLDPLASTLGVAADLVERSGDMEDGEKAKAAAVLIMSIMQNLQNKTWLSGMSDVLGVIEDPKRNTQYFIERLGGSIAVPAISAQTARTLDPVQRETGSGSMGAGVRDAIKARIPGQSQTLLPKRDVWGDEVSSEGGLGPDLLSPVWVSEARDDPVGQAVLDAGATIGPVSRQVGGAKLPDGLFNQYQAIAGRLTRQYIQDAMRAPEWRSMSGDERKEAIEAARNDAREDARSALTAGGS